MEDTILWRNEPNASAKWSALGGEDRSVAIAFLTDPPGALLRWSIDVPCGRRHLQRSRSLIEARSREATETLRCDLVADMGNERWAVELKPRAFPDALSQAYAYAVTLSEDYPRLKPWRPVIVAFTAHPVTRRLAAEFGVHVLTIHPVPPAQLFDAVRPERR